jgi:hypothetical protein
MNTLILTLMLTPAAPVPAEAAVRLPISPAPIQVLASMDKDGNIVFVSSVTVFKTVPLAVDTPGGGKKLEKTIVSETSYRSQVFAVKDVQVYDTANGTIDSRKLPVLLKERIPVLVSADGNKVDPLHLRIIKDGTLVFVVPSWKARPAPPTELPPGK